MNFISKLRQLVGLKNKSAHKRNERLASKRKKENVQARLQRRFEAKLKLMMDKFEFAVRSAQNTLRYDRKMLYNFYEQFSKEGHTFSQLRTVRIEVQASNFELRNEIGNSDEILKQILQRPWFEKYIGYFVDTQAWGHSLIEFESFCKSEHPLLTNEVDKIALIPREHVRPEYCDILIDLNDSKGIPYKEEPYLIEIGERYNLGFLEVLGKEVIYKNYSRTDWATNNERFGSPFLTIRTATNDEKELDKKEEMAAEFGSNGYAILDDQDQIDLLESSKASEGYKTFLENMLYSDGLISKIVAGQTGTADEKAFVGSAEVHERILGQYVRYLLRAMQYHFNSVLKKKLIEFGYPLEGYELHFLDLEKKDKEREEEHTLGKD